MGDTAPSQKDIAEKALDMANSGPTDGRPTNEPTPHRVAEDTPLPDYPPSGAFDAEGHEPALRRSRER